MSQQQSIIASILSGLASSYHQASDVETSPEEVVIGRNWTKEMVRAANPSAKVATTPKATTTHRDSGRRETKLDSHGKPLIHGIALPDKGTLNARNFLIALRDAGLRVSPEGQKYLDPSEVRHDSIRAIAAYCGYDSRLNYGPQEMAAKSQANRELKPLKVNKDETWQRNGAIQGVIGGFVKGVPDMVSARIANLKGRERLAAGALASHRRDFLDAKRSLDERATSQVLMDLEEQRISEIRADLRALGLDRPVFADE
jgi:hypothetical protein